MIEFFMEHSNTYHIYDRGGKRGNNTSEVHIYSLYAELDATPWTLISGRIC